MLIININYYYCEYPGDEGLRAATQIPKKRRGNAREPLYVVDGTLRVNYDQYLAARRPGRISGPSRLCSGDLALLKKYMRSYERYTSAMCNVCGKKTGMKCGLCNLACCYKSDKTMNSVSCSVDLHDTNYFGLVTCDRVKLFGENRNSYKKPTKREVDKNAKHIKELEDKFRREQGSRG